MTRSTKPNENSQVIDFAEVREKKLEEKRRTNERVFFKNMLGMYCVVGQENQVQRMRKIEIIDVSEKGLSFQVTFDPSDPWPSSDKDMPIRMYFSQDSYLPLHLKIQNSRPGIENGVRVIRYGCTVDTGVTTYECYQQFVRFLKLYAEHSHQDTGSITHFYV